MYMLTNSAWSLFDLFVPRFTFTAFKMIPESLKRLGPHVNLLCLAVRPCVLQTAVG